ncbi:M23 family metallopeptidase [Bacillus tianshenii]|nr:M23 family metallopeptidase [Bacillus tianshenii]
MRNRVNEARKRIERRKKQRKLQQPVRTPRSGASFIPSDEERFGAPPDGNLFEPSFQQDGKKKTFSPEKLVMQVMLASCLFLTTGILFKTQHPQLDSARAFVEKTFEQEFQFAAVSKWYNETFGTPVSLLPVQEKPQEAQNVDEPLDYALPVTGKVLETFEKNGQGVMLATGQGIEVEVIDKGVVIYAGVKDELGKTVVVQHPDGTETWYGHLENIDVALYEWVEKKGTLGKVSNAENHSGSFYFAMKRDGEFIDPSQVIKFE